MGENEKKAMEKIEYYLRNTEEKDMLKMVFLKSICTICKIDNNKALCKKLAVFCRENKLAKEVEELLENEPMENEPMDQLRTAVQYHAMLAITAMSRVKAIAQDEIRSLLNACFKAIFYLPPKEVLNIHLYNHTMHAMDNMLQMLLVSHRTSSSEELQNILEVLLHFASSQDKTVQARAMERLWKLSSFIASNSWQEPFAKFLEPSQRTDIVCMTLETIGEGSTEDMEWAISMLDVVLQDPATWMMDVPEILEFIQRNLGSSSTSLQEALFSVLDVLTIQSPRDVLRSVLTDLPQCDSTTLDIWKRIVTLPENSEWILDELCSIFQDKELCGIFNVTTVELGLLRFTVMDPTEENLQELHNPAQLRQLLKIESLPLVWLVLRGLVLLSESSEMARRIRVLLPEVMGTLRFANTPIALKVLNIFRNVMTHLGKYDATLIAVNLAEDLLPLFNHVASEVREGSICLFKDLMNTVVWCQKRNMKKTVRKALLPLVFQMSDETPSIAEVSGETLIACAKFLKWKNLKHLAKRKKKMEIKECLVQQNRQMVDEYLWQNLPYLRDSQASLRYEAVEFIGEPNLWVPLWALS
ncbi:uncharacterized protein LOC104915311 isoform X2 [Meleagris gallopavo]|nr:uncharacterized protein LOC104915311 isoform X2 [Meleagris gallopavo]